MESILNARKNCSSYFFFSFVLFIQSGSLKIEKDYGNLLKCIGLDWKYPDC